MHFTVKKCGDLVQGEEIHGLPRAAHGHPVQSHDEISVYC